MIKETKQLLKMDSIVWQQYKLVLSSENVAGLKFSQEKDWQKNSINNPDLVFPKIHNLYVKMNLPRQRKLLVYTCERMENKDWWRKWNVFTDRWSLVLMLWNNLAEKQRSEITSICIKMTFSEMTIGTPTFPPISLVRFCIVMRLSLVILEMILETYLGMM